MSIAKRCFVTMGLGITCNKNLELHLLVKQYSEHMDVIMTPL